MRPLTKVAPPAGGDEVRLVVGAAVSDGHDVVDVLRGPSAVLALPVVAVEDLVSEAAPLPG
jgi:hypothetical protein